MRIWKEACVRRKKLENGNVVMERERKVSSVV